MSEHADKLVFLEPTEVQKLRLALAQRDCDVNIARRCHIESEMRLYQLVIRVAEAGLPMILGELARLEEEAAQLTAVWRSMIASQRRGRPVSVRANTRLTD